MMKPTMAARAHCDRVLDRIRATIGEPMYVVKFKVRFAIVSHEFSGVLAEFA
jgi:hypothetical protein